MNVINKILKNKIKLAIIVCAVAFTIVLALVICLACFPGTENSSPDPSNPLTNNGETNSNTSGEENSTGENNNNTNGSSNNNSTGSNSNDNSGVPFVKIDPFDYMEEPVIAGVNKEATFSISLDKEKLAQTLAGPEPTSDIDEAWSQWFSSYSQNLEYVETISVTCSKTTNIENGDIILVELSIPDALCEKIKNATKTYSISGLTDIEYYNFFDNITVKFEGMSGEASARIENKTNSEIVEYCNFNITPQFNLSNGGIITVSITNAEYLKSEYFVVPEELSRDYVVSGLYAYTNSVSQLPIEDIEQFAKRFYEDSLESLQSDDTYIYENIEYSGTYFCVSNGSGYSWNRPCENIIEIVISYDYSVLGVDMGRTTTSLYFTDIIIDSTGAVSLSYEDGAESIEFIDKDCYDITPITITIPTD